MIIASEARKAHTYIINRTKRTHLSAVRACERSPLAVLLRFEEPRFFRLPRRVLCCSFIVLYVMARGCESESVPSAAYLVRDRSVPFLWRASSD